MRPLRFGGEEWRWHELLVGVPVVFALVAMVVAFTAGGGSALLYSGIKEVRGAYDDPHIALRCSRHRVPGCITVERGVAQPGSAEVDLLVRTERTTEPVKLIRDVIPESGTALELEYRNRKLVSLFDPRSRRRYHTEQWPRHGRDLGYGIFKLLAGVLLLTVFPGLALGALVRAGVGRLVSRRRVR